LADLIIRNAVLLDPAAPVRRRGELVIESGCIVAHEARGLTAQRELDAAGLLVVPGFVDPHVHLREPGKEAAETIATGTAAAAAGGYTSVAVMPNTTPPLDKAERVRWLMQRASEVGAVRVWPVACITTRRAGKQIADLEALAAAGAIAFSDDGSGVADPVLMREALERARDLGRPVLSHCEEPTLSRDGVMHEGAVAAALGLPGMPAAAEEVMAARDISLARLSGARLHLQHVSSAGTVELIRTAKRAGVALTAEVTPHHLCLTDEDARCGDTSFKMNPPLRTARDRDALRAALADGTIDCIATDHAPHTVEEKRQDFRQAPFGCIGLESAFAVLWTELVLSGIIAQERLIAALTQAPAQVLGLPFGTLGIGAAADVTLIDPNYHWRIEPERFRSRARNCPFAGWRVTGKVVATIVGGMIRFEEGR